MVVKVCHSFSPISSEIEVEGKLFVRTIHTYVSSIFKFIFLKTFIKYFFLKHRLILSFQMQVLFVVVAVLMAVAALILLVIGAMSTGSTRKELYRLLRKVLCLSFLLDFYQLVDESSSVFAEI